MRLDDPSSGLPATPLESLALEGMSLAAFVEYWSRYAELAVPGLPAEPREEDRALAAELAPLAGRTGTMLEIGCSTGRLLRALSDALPDHAVHGYDVAPAALDRARADLADLADLARLRLHLGNGYDLAAFDDGSVDLVVSTHTLQHVPKPVALNLLKEAHRVLSPGGRLWLELPNLLRDDRLLAFNHFAQPAMVQRPFPMFFWTPAEAVRLLTFAGFWVWSVSDRMDIVAGKTGVAGVASGVPAGAASA